MQRLLWVLSAVVVAVSACKVKDQTADRAQPGDQQGMSGMKMDSMPMDGGRMGIGDAASMPMMQAHMDSMMRVSPEQMSAMMATHERMMSQMMDRMGADMRGMNMNGDAKWNALADSVKADLAELPGLRRGELVARMKAHTARVQRLIAMHEGMMKGM
jgi:hypothetical protein